MWKSGTAVFDPATLALSGWWRASFAGSPWVARASAGSSGSNGNLTEGTNPPATGSAVNGLTPADFDGTNDILSNATAITTMVSDASGSLVCLFYADTAFADPGSTSFYLEPSLIGNATSKLSLSFSTAGVSLGTFNGAAWNAVRTACGTGAWHLAQARWDNVGGNIEVRVDSGSWQTLARALAMAGGNVQVGLNYDIAWFDGKILEVMTAPARLADADFTNIVSYVNSRYALAL